VNAVALTAAASLLGLEEVASVQQQQQLQLQHWNTGEG
jgi:hypothetical protein